MLSILIAVVVLITCLYAVHAFVPLDQRIKTVLQLALLLFFLIYVLGGRL